MRICLQWVEGNKYAAWLIDEKEGIHVFLGYHFTYTQLPLETIQHNLETGLSNALTTIVGR